jgi:hypothetical protein
MAEQKTKATDLSVAAFLDKIEDKQVRDDCKAISKIMEKVSGSKPKMWGSSIVGFGSYHYKYDSGHEGDACLTGFAPRKGNITLYIMLGLNDPELLKKLGKHKTGKGCLYVKKLEDVDVKILEKLIRNGVDGIKKKYK